MQSTDSPDLSGDAVSPEEEEHEVTLYAEDPVVEERVVPKEQIEAEHGR